MTARARAIRACLRRAWCPLCWSRCCCPPAASLVYGLCLQAGTHVAGPLLGHLLVGLLGCAYYGPDSMSYTSSLKQSAAAAAASASMALNCASSGRRHLGGAPQMRSLGGVGGVFGLMAALNVVVIAWGGAHVAADVRRHHARAQSEAATAPVAALGAEGAVGRPPGAVTVAVEPACKAAAPVTKESEWLPLTSTVSQLRRQQDACNSP